MTNGIVWRLGEDEFVGFFLSPYLDHLVASVGYDVRAQDLSAQRFLFRGRRPTVLNELERTTGESLRDRSTAIGSGPILHPSCGKRSIGSSSGKGS